LIVYVPVILKQGGIGIGPLIEIGVGGTVLSFTVHVAEGSLKAPHALAHARTWYLRQSTRQLIMPAQTSPTAIAIAENTSRDTIAHLYFPCLAPPRIERGNDRGRGQPRGPLYRASRVAQWPMISRRSSARRSRSRLRSFATSSVT
jgi:hypothetical protein